MSLLEHDRTVEVVLAEQLARCRALLKEVEWSRENECPWCEEHDTLGHDIDCRAFTPSGLPK